MDKKIDNVIIGKPTTISSDDSLPVSYQSANTFFHFMNKQKYLYEIINDKKIYPRYCEENISEEPLSCKLFSLFYHVFQFLLSW